METTNKATNTETLGASRRPFLTTRDLCHIGIFAAIIAILAQISIPMPLGVPITLQTFAILFAAIVLGAKKGTIATLVYVAVGAVGLPVFANFMGGMGVILGMTGGFLLSFPIMALLAGLGNEKSDNSDKKSAILWLIVGLVVGVAINFLCGMLWFSMVTGSSISVSFVAAVLPFIPTSIVQIGIAAAFGRHVRKTLVKNKIIA
ncbi:MAG: biotin transporter BioY [Clostridiales bacterium]|nr:biotin transporter BioY [Clostridiales bacterium]